MASLADLHESAILFNLHKRYQENKIYVRREERNAILLQLYMSYIRSHLFITLCAKTGCLLFICL